MYSGLNRYVFQLAFLLGIFPFKFVDSRFQISRLGLLFCLLNFIGGILINLFTIIQSVEDLITKFGSKAGGNLNEIITVVAFMIFAALSVIFGVVNAFNKRHISVEILNEINFLYNLKGDVKGSLHRGTRRDLNKFLAAIALMVCSVTFYVGYDIVQHFQYHGTMSLLLLYFGIDWCSIIPLCAESLFALYCMYICTCFDEICTSKSGDLELLNTIYIKLFVITGKMNQRFGLDFLISLSSSPLILISSLFVLISMVLGIGTFNELNPMYMVSYAISSFARAFYVCYFCRRINKKAERTRNVLINRCCSPLHVEPPPSISGIVSKGQQNITFDACGYIQISMDLLAAIVGNVVTYLVVLIQFQLMKK